MIRALSIVTLLLCLGTSVRGQEPDTRNELWTRFNVYVPLDEKFRLYFMVTGNRAEETRKSFETTVGAHVDYLANKRFIFRAGYRYTFTDDDPEHRIVTEQTFRQELPLAILLSDRNRQDWRFMGGVFSFRYRNRVRLEREFRMWGRSFTPYDVTP